MLQSLSLMPTFWASVYLWVSLLTQRSTLISEMRPTLTTTLFLEGSFLSDVWVQPGPPHQRRGEVIAPGSRAAKMPAAGTVLAKATFLSSFKHCTVQVIISELLCILRFCCTNECINRVKLFLNYWAGQDWLLNHAKLQILNYLVLWKWQSVNSSIWVNWVFSKYMQKPIWNCIW